MKSVPTEGIVGVEALREAASTELTQIIGLVRAALQARYDAAKKPGESYAWFDVEAMYPDRAIVCKDGRYWQFSYSLDASNQVMLGDPVEVVEEFNPVSLREAADAKDGAWRTINGRRVFIAKGESAADAVEKSLIGDKATTQAEHRKAMTYHANMAKRAAQAGKKALAAMHERALEAHTHAVEKGDKASSMKANIRSDEAHYSAAMKESIDAGTVFLEAKDAEGKIWDAVLLRSGASMNGTFYTDAVLREAAPLFEGARVLVRSDAEHLTSPMSGKAVRNIAGWVTGSRFVEGGAPDTGQIRGQVNLAAGMRELRETLADAWARGKRDLVGLSIDAVGSAKAAMRGAAKRVAQSITKVNSVDLIVEPSAGGALVRLVEAADPKEQSEMAIKEKMQARIKAKFPQLDVAALTDDELEARYAEAIAPEKKEDTAPGGAGADDGDKPVTREELRMVEARANARSAIAGSNLPQPAKDRLQARFDGLARFAEADVTTEIKAEREYLARMTESGRVQLGGLDIEVGDRSKKVGEMFDAFFDPAHKDHRSVQSFKECYIEVTGDRRVTGRLENIDRSRLAESVGEAFRESLDSTSWANVLGSAITRRLVADYRRPNQYSGWRQTVNVVPVADFRTNERTRFGGYGDLPAVAQGAAYLALTSPTDEKATYAASKRGGTEDVTLEMVKNDDVGAIRQIPVKLSRSAQRTLAKFVFDFIRTNPTLYDTVAFFHATHGNLGSAALDATTLAAARLRMLKQAEADSSDRLGIPPKFLIVPVDLEGTAVGLFNRDTNLDKTFIQTQQLTVIPVWYWTDANDWAIGADPMELPSIEVGFLDGNEEPELFVQDNPTVGSMFSNDKLTYKIRHVYGGQVINYRGFDKSVVA